MSLSETYSLSLSPLSRGLDDDAHSAAQGSPAVGARCPLPAARGPAKPSASPGSPRALRRGRRAEQLPGRPRPCATRAASTASSPPVPAPAPLTPLQGTGSRAPCAAPGEAVLSRTGRQLCASNTPGAARLSQGGAATPRTPSLARGTGWASPGPRRGQRTPSGAGSRRVDPEGQPRPQPPGPGGWSRSPSSPNSLGECRARSACSLGRSAGLLACSNGEDLFFA